MSFQGIRRNISTTLAVLLIAGASAFGPSPPYEKRVTFCPTRRALFAAVMTAVAAPAAAKGENSWRQYTALAPLGSASAKIGLGKRTGLSLEALAGILEHDVTAGATDRGSYFITGDIRPEIFQDDCRFVDPTNDVRSLARYAKALTILFDPAKSRVELLGPPLVDPAARTVSAEIRSEGTLKLPWAPRVSPYTSRVTWRVSTDGLVEEQSQVWSISAAAALIESFTPARAQVLDTR